MHYTIERILSGDDSIASNFASAKRFFEELFGPKRDESVEDWAQWLSQKQHVFELHCGGRYEGQEVMAWTGFGMLYSTDVGFEENQELATKLADAFERSMVSLEVKGHAKEAVASYHVRD